MAAVPAAAIVALVAGRASFGSEWAIAVCYGLASVVMAGIVYAFFFGLCTGLAVLVGREDIVARTSRGAVRRESDQSPSEDELQPSVEYLPNPSGGS
ncbi:hypothetical protein HG15A2_27010 [Adhaeretor mobilis]|uniref:Uncharacterized protein n=2 Tax=Adhaeretor mobilis TaxID=1930276 RepID=A0A517MWX5_9BACT|nr:hypothetical protein HG15A2_27010 [Adhaeretor mobilis]